MRHSYESQLFRIHGDNVEYCFAYNNPAMPTTGADQAPFKIVPSDADNELNFCWSQARLPSHKANCTGCDCARMTIRVDGDTLNSVFLQSPPAVHMNVTLKRTGDAFSAEQVRDGWNCQLSNHTGKVTPNKTDALVAATRAAAHTEQRVTVVAPTIVTPDASGQVRNCVIVNPVINVKLEYVASKLPCMPCDVTFTVSADTTSKSTYVALGFKEMYAAYYDFDEQPLDIPNYWGMATSDDNATELAGRIIAGYTTATGKSCVREMRANAYVGSIIDVPSDGLVRNATASRLLGRTSVEFTASIHAGETAADIAWAGQIFGRQRVQWAIGPVAKNDDCSAPLEYHFGNRAASSLDFPGFGSTCGSSEVMLSTDMNVMV